MIEKGIARTTAFTMRDSTTGQPKTTLNAGDVTVRVSKDGGAFAAATNTPVAIQDTGANTGEFAVTLTATEMNADAIVIKATAVGCIEVRQKISTEAAYTAARAGYVDNLSGGAVALNGTVAKEATLSVVAGYIDTEITAIINAIASLQADLGDPSVDATTIYAKILALQAAVAVIPTTINSELTATHGSGVWGPGFGGDKVVTMTVRDNLTDATIPDVVYYVFDTEGVIRYSGMTDGNGAAVFNANSGNYTVKLHKALVNFAASYSLVVSGNVNVTFKGDLLTIPIPTVPGMCVIIADLAAVGMAPKAGVKLTATVKQPPKTINGIFLDQEPWEAVTQPNGRATLEVPQGVIWNVSFAPIGMDIEVDTTGAASINLKDKV